LRGDPARRDDINSPGDDLSKAPYFVETNGSPDLNLLFAALFDLIICRGTKMGLFVPSSHRNLDTIFADKVPQIHDDEVPTWLVSADILAYLKWLIYTAAFKEPTLEPRGSIHEKFYKAWRRAFRSSEDVIRKKLKKMLEVWYAKHPPTRKNAGRKSDFAEHSDEEKAPVIKIYHDSDDDTDRDDLPPSAEGGDGGGGGI
jgi:hypothetical protein